ncbi:MAG: DUF4390 domain-containing protein [Thermodesulfovibrionales bacterium]|nr:DUF4390 domain-containing protein [Thermodesulfovibrionales bacterium]
MSVERSVLCLVLGICLSLLFSGAALAAEIAGPEVALKENSIVVSSSLSLSEAELKDIRNGIPKEIIFHVDLFRVWPYWPDEFVLGAAFTKTLRCDPVKKEYVATSFDGMTLTEKRFSGCEPLAAWALRAPEFKLTNVSELAPDLYFVRVTAESRLRRLPPVINHLLFFVREKEFSVSKDSERFQAGGRK